MERGLRQCIVGEEPSHTYDKVGGAKLLVRMTTQRIDPHRAPDNGKLRAMTQAATTPGPPAVKLKAKSPT